MSELPNRKSYRIRCHNYAEANAYHITICAHRRQLLFGSVIDAKMHLSATGTILEEEIQRTGLLREQVVIDSHIVMPNHVHVILVLTGGADAPAPRTFAAPASGTVSSMINGWKAACTSRIRKEIGPPSLVVWQPRFYDRLIRDENELEYTRHYILNNPGAWEDDPENPERKQVRRDNHKVVLLPTDRRDVLRTSSPPNN
jgi:putative transposase